MRLSHVSHSFHYSRYKSSCCRSASVRDILHSGLGVDAFSCVELTTEDYHTP